MRPQFDTRDRRPIILIFIIGEDCNEFEMLQMVEKSASRDYRNQRDNVFKAVYFHEEDDTERWKSKRREVLNFLSQFPEAYVFVDIVSHSNADTGKIRYATMHAVATPLSVSS